MTRICHSNNSAELIKERLTMDEVARHYGFEPNRSGFLKCPFHQGDHTASLKIYPGAGGWHCFGCGAGGTVIDFVMRLYDINFRQAILRINADFGLDTAPGERLTVAQASKLLQERAREEAELSAYRAEYDRRTALYRGYWQAIKAGPDDSLYEEAVKNIDALNYWFEEHPWR